MQMTGSLKSHQRRLEGGRKKESIVISKTNGMYGYLESNKLENQHPKKKQRTDSEIFRLTNKLS